MPGIEISQLPLQNLINPDDLFVIAIQPYTVLGSNRAIKGSTLLALRPQYQESCIQGTTNIGPGVAVIPGQNLILSEGEYILNWSSSYIHGNAGGTNEVRIAYNTNQLITAYDPSDVVVMCSSRFLSLSSAVDRVSFHTCGRIVIPAGQTWIIKPTVNNVVSAIVSIGSDNILTSLKIA